METDWEMSIYNNLMSHVKSKSRNHVKHLSWFPTKTRATIMHKLDGEKKKTIYGNQKWGKIQQKYDFCLRTRNHEETCGLNIVYYFPLP